MNEIMRLIDKNVLLTALDEVKADEYIFGTNKTMKQLFKEIIEVLPYISLRYEGLDDSLIQEAMSNGRNDAKLQ